MDAESQGVEGFYYTYTFDELSQSLLSEELQFLIEEMNISQEGNWEKGLNIIHFNEENYSHRLVKTICSKLRVLKPIDCLPFVDKKIQLSWNALWIIGLCDAFQSTQDTKFLYLAKQMVLDIESKMMINSSLYHSSYQDKLSKNSYLEDYAYFIKALRFLNLATGDMCYEEKALKCFKEVFKQFEKDKQGFFYKTGSIANSVSVDTFAKLEDDIMPSANSIFQSLCFYFGVMESNSKWILESEQMLEKIKGKSYENPVWFSNWLLNEWNQKNQIAIKISGKNTVSVFRLIIKKAPYLEQSIRLDERADDTSIMICLKDRCLDPIVDIVDFFHRLDELVIHN
jgi:hypothetical protein